MTAATNDNARREPLRRSLECAPRNPVSALRNDDALDGESMAHDCAGKYLSSVDAGERLNESPSERGHAALKAVSR